MARIRRHASDFAIAPAFNVETPRSLVLARDRAFCATAARWNITLELMLHFTPKKHGKVLSNPVCSVGFAAKMERYSPFGSRIALIGCLLLIN